ncbi:unnamed protein product [Clonostachys rosea]|uniref:Uncharacterized protein n=1 Tax=Bionectria ochroleuca TaxID=29856 RepID=A0ABY6U6A0_BIOOC|nr:unnamed protein product [Clonostachys rosea]
MSTTKCFKARDVNEPFTTLGWRIRKGAAFRRFKESSHQVKIVLLIKTVLPIPCVEESVTATNVATAAAGAERPTEKRKAKMRSHKRSRRRDPSSDPYGSDSSSSSDDPPPRRGRHGKKHRHRTDRRDRSSSSSSSSADSIASRERIEGIKFKAETIGGFWPDGGSAPVRYQGSFPTTRKPPIARKPASDAKPNTDDESGDEDPFASSPISPLSNSVLDDSPPPQRPAHITKPKATDIFLYGKRT